MKRSLLNLTVLILAVSTPCAALEPVQRTTIASEHGAVEVVLFFISSREASRQTIQAMNRLMVGADELGLDSSFRSVACEPSEDIEPFFEKKLLEGEVVSDSAAELVRTHGLRTLPSAVIARGGRGPRSRRSGADPRGVAGTADVDRNRSVHPPRLGLR